MSDVVEIKVPVIGESLSTVFIGTWKKAVGDTITAGETLVEVDSDKASLEVPAPVSGVVEALLFEEGDEVAISAIIARITPGKGGAVVAAAAPADAGSDAASDSSKGPQSGPAARQAAARLGVDVDAVSGSGKGGRVLRGDVEAAAKKPAPAATPAAPASPPRAIEADDPARIERVRMTPLRRTIARRLVEAQHNAAMLTTFNEVDLTRVKALRKSYQEKFIARHGVKLGYMSFFVKAAVEALKAFPAVNSEIDGNDILYKRYYNIGVAVSTEKGLVVPVIRDADRLSFAEVETTINGLATRARDGKLTLSDFKDGTFTISNGGVFGSLMSTPILNAPQVGILGMHTIQDRPVGIDGQIVLRPMMYLAMSYDHRVIDGREAVSFLGRIKELIEDPERMLLEV
ncbi:MAG: 2-oxoglutarate dehydrogenase E2 component (dihydrolipoamide succinyltransferase) [Myxococcota bacterium]|jgi:2-oxoglutarate dehydrogenase E2 component (dihydrolipoamide succinyltransferase)